MVTLTEKENGPHWGDRFPKETWMMWAMSQGETVPESMKKALDFFRDKYGQEPKVVYINRHVEDDLRGVTDGIKVIKVDYVSKMNFYIG